MSATPPLDPLEALREALTASDLERVREVISPLSADERAALRRQALPEITKGIQSAIEGVQNTWTQGRDWRGSIVIDDAFRRRLDRPEATLRAYRLAAVGIGLKKDVDSALFSARVNSFSMDSWQDEPQRSLSYQAGLLLLTRDEPWRDDVLCRLLDSELRTGFPNEGAFELSLRLLQEGRGPQDRVLAAAARQGRRLGFRIWVKDGPGFPWRTDVGRKVLWAALEARDEPFLASIDSESVGSPLIQRICEITAAGEFERTEVSALALRRLAESSRAFEAGWWARLLEALELSEAEWRSNSESMLDLIGAPNPRAVSVGLSAAAKLFRKRLLDPGELVPVLSLAVTAPAAGTAKSAVLLLRKCAEQDKYVRLDALTAALAALQHPKPAVHDAVLQWLEADSWWREDLPALSVVADASVTAPPGSAARLDALLPTGEAGTGPTARSQAPGDLSELAAEVNALRERETDPRRCEWLAALERAVAGGDLPAYSPDLTSRWRECPPFSLPESVDETAAILLGATVRVLEQEDWERIGVGVRLPLSPAEKAMLPRLLDPLLRFRESPSRESKAYVPFLQRGGLAALRVAEAWAGLPSTETGDGDLRLRVRDSHHVQSILAAIERRDPFPPLGTPTHEGGWLDPGAFSERLLRRQDLPDAEIWELSAALYRLAPDPAGRLAAWGRIAPHLSRFGEVGAIMLAAALAPGAEGERAQARLAVSFRENTGGWQQFQDTVAGGLSFVMGLIGQRGAGKPGTSKNPELGLRVLTSSLRCRYGMSDIPLLRDLAEALPAPYRRLLEPAPAPGPSTAMTGPEWQAHQNRLMAAIHLSETTPEMQLLTEPGYRSQFDTPFRFPAMSAAMADAGLRKPFWMVHYGLAITPAVALLRRPDVPVLWLLKRLLERVPDDKENGTAVAGLLALALADGRLLLRDIAAAFGPELGRSEAKPRALLAVLELLVRQYPPAREAAMAAAEAAAGRGLGAVNPGDRVRLLELFLQWRSESGSPFGDAAVRSALEGLAAKGKNNRAGSLARQVLDVPVRRSETPRQAANAHDVRTMLANHRFA